MPNRRKEVIATGEVYHIYNRSISDTEIFNQKRPLNHAIKLIDYYQYHQKLRYSKFQALTLENRLLYLGGLDTKNPLVEIFCFAFMPNHFHFLLKQMQDNGIREFISNFQNGFAKYFNLRQNREGGLFQSPFKSKRIVKDEDLLQVSRYIHLNPVTSFLIKHEQLKDHLFTSYPNYVGTGSCPFVKTHLILELAGTSEKYEKFISDHVDYQRKLDFIKHLLHD